MNIVRLRYRGCGHHLGRDFQSRLGDCRFLDIGEWLRYLTAYPSSKVGTQTRAIPSMCRSPAAPILVSARTRCSSYPARAIAGRFLKSSSEITQIATNPNGIENIAGENSRGAISNCSRRIWAMLATCAKTRGAVCAHGNIWRQSSYRSMVRATHQRCLPSAARIATSAIGRISA